MRGSENVSGVEVEKSDGYLSLPRDVRGIFVKQWGVKHVYVQLYKHMHCRLGDGLNTASDSPIDWLPESPWGELYDE
uniref:Uncharacterized protein n=1 Tax=Magallana gigas TaxID=29159 RepID=K1QYD4_MAGGI